MKTKMLLMALCFSCFVFSQSQYQTEISSQSNDAEVLANNTVSFDSSDLELSGKDGTNLQETFLYFNVNSTLKY